jgi:hypothetical protein
VLLICCSDKINLFLFCANAAENREMIFCELLFSEPVSPMMSCHWHSMGRQEI